MVVAAGVVVFVLVAAAVVAVVVVAAAAVVFAVFGVAGGRGHGVSRRGSVTGYGGCVCGVGGGGGGATMTVLSVAVSNAPSTARARGRNMMHRSNTPWAQGPVNSDYTRDANVYDSVRAEMMTMKLKLVAMAMVVSGRF